MGLAIVTSAFDNYLTRELAKLVSSEQAHDLLRSTALIHELSGGLRERVIRAFAEAFTVQMKITTAFAALQMVGIAMIWKRKQISVVEKK